MSEKPLFLRALAHEKVERPPVWFMRQAGRCLPEYRELRAKHSFLEVCKTPELACEVTLQPIRRFGYDASIVFSDILVIPEAMGQTLTFGAGMGPMLDPPLRSEDAVKDLRPVEVEESLGYVMGAIKAIVSELPDNIPLIGFAGAPFTVACYMIEGKGSKHFIEIKRMMYARPDLMNSILDQLVDATAAYLRAQVEAGCRAIQLFDTWAGELSSDDLERFAVDPARRIFDKLKDLDVPKIYFARGCADTLDIVQKAGADCYGLDWRARITKSWEALGADKGIQGNLDPSILHAPPDVIKKKTQAILDEVDGRPGHIFNLGHGIHPFTPIESVHAVIDTIRA